jgi:tetratricopeptide (TPR) repeat protein
LRLRPKDPYFGQQDADARARRAAWQIDRGEVADAREALTSALRDSTDPTRDPSIPGAWISSFHASRGSIRTWLGRARARSGESPLPDWGAAEEEFARAVAAFADDPDVFVARALLGIEREAYRAARGGPPGEPTLRAIAADIERALTLEPGHAEAWVARGDLARLRGQPEPARAAYSRAVDLNPFLTHRLARLLSPPPEP